MAMCTSVSCYSFSFGSMLFSTSERDLHGESSLLGEKGKSPVHEFVCDELGVEGVDQCPEFRQ